MKREPLKQRGLLRLKPLPRTAGLTGGGGEGEGKVGFSGGRGAGGRRYVGLGKDRQTDLTLPPYAVPSCRWALRPLPQRSGGPVRPPLAAFSSMWLFRGTVDAADGG